MWHNTDSNGIILDNEGLIRPQNAATGFHDPTVCVFWNIRGGICFLLMGRLEEKAVGHESRIPRASQTYDGKTRERKRGLKCVAVKCCVAAGGPHLDANIIH